MRRFLPLLLLSLLAGCAWLATDKGAWSKPNVGEAETAADLDSCRQSANAKLARDERIQQDIGTADMGSGPTTQGSLEANLGQYRASKRFDRLVGDCMTARGYVQGAAGAE